MHAKKMGGAKARSEERKIIKRRRRVHFLRRIRQSASDDVYIYRREEGIDGLTNDLIGMAIRYMNVVLEQSTKDFSQEDQ